MDLLNNEEQAHASSTRSGHIRSAANDSLMNGASEISRREFCASALAASLSLTTKTFSDSTKHHTDFKCQYTLSDYKSDVVNIGLKNTWEKICGRVMAEGEDEDGILRISNFGELYEIGLALTNKDAKKSNGQYFTPPDVCRIMAEWFDRCKGDIICDVGCGVGNLILGYFKYIGKDRATKILSEGRLHLYDLDEVAIFVCVKSLAIRYGRDVERMINVHQGDFLDTNLCLPKNCKVITNPPYAAVGNIPESWPQSDVIRESKELYAAFMEKILRESQSSVIITPYSFIGGKMFYPLRRLMSSHEGFVVSFDNVPGTIFCGRKHGIFNSNTGNSVRAAITVVENEGTAKGFRFSPLIRFKAAERERLLKCNVLESFVGTKHQVVDHTHTMFAKCDRRLEDVFNAWLNASETHLEKYLCAVGKHKMFVPNSCRYFTVAASRSLSRKGQMSLCFSDEDVFWYTFCMVNSSFAYWHWRLYDGGITYPKGLLLQMPMFVNRLNTDDKIFLKSIAKEMIACSDKYIITKNNVGAQENIKYPHKYRNAINQRLLNAIGINKDAKIFDIVHSNMALEVSI